MSLTEFGKFEILRVRNLKRIKRSSDSWVYEPTFVKMTSDVLYSREYADKTECTLNAEEEECDVIIHDQDHKKEILHSLLDDYKKLQTKKMISKVNMDSLMGMILSNIRKIDKTINFLSEKKDKIQIQLKEFSE